MWNSLFLFLIICITGTALPLKNSYVPGSVAPPRGWFPLRNSDFSFARKVADSLLTAYLVQKKVTKNLSENRLEGSTEIPQTLVENLCGNRLGETGTVFLKGKRLGDVELTAFHLNWCDFYGALIETEYTPKVRFNVDHLSPDALLVRGLFAYKVKALALKELAAEEKAIKQFFLEMDPPPFDFIAKMEFSVFEYPAGKNRRLVLANFEAGQGFSPGALYLLEKAGASYSVVSNYFIGEKAEIMQVLMEEGDPDPVIHVGTFGSGTEYIVVHYNGKEFEAAYKRKEGDFP